MTFSQGKIIEKKQIFLKPGRYFGKYLKWIIIMITFNNYNNYANIQSQWISL